MTDEALQLIYQVLAREHHERSVLDLKDVARMVGAIPFFNQIVLKDESLKDEDYIEMAKYLTHEHVEAGDYLCYQGEKSTKMYVLLKGKIGLFKQA